MWRELITEYQSNIENLPETLSKANLAEVVEFAGWPSQVRGYGGAIAPPRYRQRVVRHRIIIAGSLKAFVRCSGIFVILS